MIASALFNRDHDIDGLAHAGLEERNVQAGVAGVMDVGLGVLDQDLEVATVLEFGAHALGIFVELGGVVGFGKNIFKNDGVRNADRLEVLHGPAQGAGLDVDIAAELNFSDFDLRAFLDDEGEADGGGRNGADFGANDGKLAAVLGEQIFEYDFGFLDFGGIVLALDGETDLTLLEFVEHIAGGDRAQADVVDLADGGALFDVDVEDPALGALFALKADVFEVAGVPEGVEVALEGGGVIDVADFGEDAGFYGFGGDAAAAVNLDADDEVLLTGRRGGEKKHEQERQEGCPCGPARSANAGAGGRSDPLKCGAKCGASRWSGAWAAVGAAAWALEAAMVRGAHRNSLMTALNCNYLEKIELGKR